MKQMFKQIRDFMENAFSKFQCDFRKGYSTQQCLIALIEKWKSATEILFGVPHGSFSGSLLFNIFICELFIMIHDINVANYAGDNTPFVSGYTPLNIITSLENAAEIFFEWFTNNHMKAHHDKCHLLMSTLAPISIKVKD